MFLKEIQMENFKSFGRKVKIPFTTGFTGVTGPNGSGKSNISDAILFVLGPKSSKVIRAGKLSDLIFNGGKTGRPALQCKVSLVFDNKDRVIQVNNDEVVLSRIVRRTSTSSTTDANSYFYINNAKSSLKEFDRLLSHARISADGYNSVQQGDVNHIANMGPVERRRILDTIAGVTRFDEEISRAEKKKVKALQDMERIGLLLDEIRTRVSSLDGEREEASQYLELQESLKNGEALIAHKKLGGVTSEANALREQLSKYRELEGELAEEKKRLEAAAAEVQVTIDKLKEEMEQKGGEGIEELREKMDTLRLQRARASDSVEDAEDSMRRLRGEKKRIASERKKVDKEILGLEEKVKILEVEATEVEAKLSTIRKEMGDLEGEAAATDGRVEGLRKEEGVLLEALQKNLDDAKGADVETEKLRIEMEAKRREKAELEERKRDMEAEEKDAEWEMKEHKKDGKKLHSVKKLQEILYAKKAEERRFTEESSDLENRVKRLEREYERARAQVEMAEKTALGYTQPVMAILEARDRGELKGVHGTVAELVTTEEGVDDALSVAAGNRMNAIVVDTDGDAEKAINLLRSNKMGRATFLPLSKMLDSRPRGKAVMASNDPESLGFAIDLLRFDEKYRAAMWYVFGDTVVVKTLKDARRLMGGVRLVTKQGELIEASGAMVGGNLAKRGRTFGISRGELERVGEELRKSRDAADDTLRTLQSVRTELVDMETQLKDASGKDEQILIRLEALAKRKDDARKEKTRFVGRIKEITSSLSKLEKTLEGLEQKKEQMEKKMGNTKGMLSNVRETLAQTTPKEVGDRLRSLRNGEKEEAAELARIRRAISELTPSLAVAKSTMESLESAVEECDEKIKSLKEGMGKKAKDGEKADIELKALSKILSSMGAEIEALRKESEGAFKKKMELERQKEKVAISMENKEDFYLGLKAKLSSLEEQQSALQTEWEEHNIQVPEKIPSMDSLKRSTQKARVAMEAMGAVNLKALKEYEKQKARYDKLNEELKQVKAEKRNLEKLVKDLVDRKTEELMRVFEAVNENFKQVYSRLSMGGEAELWLENPEAPFEGGLLINARPPGKKVLRLEALSGGEKSLVSMGFIVAIQQYDPSPFYLLDEVDQNLDAINAENLARLVREDSRSAQFIMISLRKVTLKEADTLYGVMIQKNGLSEIIGTVDLQSMKEPRIGPESRMEMGPEIGPEAKLEVGLEMEPELSIGAEMESEMEPEA